MEWLEMPDGWKILEMGKDNKSCYVYIPELNSCYGALIRIRNGIEIKRRGFRPRLKNRISLWIHLWSYL